MTVPLVPAELNRVEAWREDCAIRLGYPAKMASWIAERPIDVHELETLIRAGATKAQALRILVPLEERD